MREPLLGENMGVEAGFRCRGREVNRIESFSDAAFAFALTLMVVSLEVPKTFAELKATMRGFPGFAICFAWLVSIWFQHYRFFRRYGMQDGFTMLLNWVLLFVVLFYVYPLKFLFTYLMARVFGGPRQVLTDADAPLLMTIYGLGFAAVYVVLGLMFWHAYRHREELRLDARERILTVASLRGMFLYASVGVLSITIVQIGGAGWAAAAGFSYCLIGAASALNGWYAGTRMRKLADDSPRMPAAST